LREESLLLPRKRKELITDNKNLTIGSDNCPQMTVETLELDHEFIPPEQCNKNAHVESFVS